MAYRRSLLLFALAALVPMLAVSEARAQLVSGFVPRFPDDMVPVTLQNVGSGKCIALPNGSIEFGLQIQQLRCTGARSQQFFLALAETNGPNAYQLRTAQSAWRNLTIADDSVEDRAQLVLDDPISVGQIFRLDRQPDGSFAILARSSGKCLHIPDGSREDGAIPELLSCNGQPSQRWRITPITASQGFGMNLIAQHSDKCLEVPNASMAPGTAIHQFDCAKRSNQRWRLGTPSAINGSTYYPIIASHSSQCLDVNSTQDGSLVQQFPCIPGNPNQRWKVLDAADGYVAFQNMVSGLCLYLAPNALQNSAPLQQSACRGDLNQRFFYGIVDERHVQVVTVSDGNGNGAINQSDRGIEDNVRRVNQIYGRYGIRLVFDPETDRSEESNDALFNLNSGNEGVYTCTDGRVTDGWSCANQYAAQRWPDKLVVFSRPRFGNGFTYGDQNFIAIDWMGSNEDLICGNVPNNTFLAHEFGHYMGLNHTFDVVGDGPFDDDLLGDTLPVPRNAGMCLSPFSDRGSFNGLLAETNNVMSYFQNVGHRISPMQAYIVRAAAYARGY